MWRDVVPPLSEHHDVHAPTLLGHRGGPAVQRRPVSVSDIVDATERYLDEHGLEGAHVMTGVTKRQGGNRTVAELKAEREQEYQQKEERPALYFGESKMEQGLHF